MNFWVTRHNEPINRSEVADRWWREGFDCRLWVDPPGQEWIDFSHAVDEVVLLVQGDLIVELDGSQAHLSNGDEISIPAGVKHSVFNVGTTEARWLYGYRQRR